MSSTDTSTLAFSWRDEEAVNIVLAKSRFRTTLLRRYVAVVGLVVTVFFIALAIGGPFLAPQNPLAVSLSDRLQPPSSAHLMGTDGLGRDILSRLLDGAHRTLGIGLAAVVLAATLGVPIGLAAGYYGGPVDQISMRVVDIMLALPGILLAITIIAAFGSSAATLVLAIGMGGISPFARLARGMTLGIRAREFVEAARAVGAADGRILALHIAPNIAAPLIVEFSLRFSGTILSAAGLSFLGLGVQPPTPEWGAMLSEARVFLRVAPHMVLFPGFAIFVVVAGLNLLGDGLRDAWDPQSYS